MSGIHQNSIAGASLLPLLFGLLLEHMQLGSKCMP